MPRTGVMGHGDKQLGPLPDDLPNDEPTPPTDENVSPRTARIDDAMQYALAFMNDPEGLASAREEWRDQLRAALLDFRAIEHEASSPALDVDATRVREAPNVPPWDDSPKAIDVDLLTRLIKRVTYGDGETLGNAWRDAEQIAAEYARLAHPDSDGDAR